jgi:hypothetical protein
MMGILYYCFWCNLRKDLLNSLKIVADALACPEMWLLVIAEAIGRVIE